MSARKLKRKLESYIKFKALARSIKMVALSQLNYLKLKIGSRAISLSSIYPYYDSDIIEEKKKKRFLVTVLGVDKSCCGPHNSNSFKVAELLTADIIEKRLDVFLFTIGWKSKDYFKKYFFTNWYHTLRNVEKEPISLMTSFILTEKILRIIYTKYYFIFNRYYTPFEQNTVVYEVIGIPSYYNHVLNSENQRPQYLSGDFFSFLYKVKAVLIIILQQIYEYCLSTIFLDSLEENEYSSLGARFTAMDNSGQNATKIIDVLQLIYNKARQNSITNELIEIVSAANFV